MSTGHPHPNTGEALGSLLFDVSQNRGDRRRQWLSAKLTEWYSNVADVLDIAPEDLIQAAVFPDRIIKAENNKKNT